MLAFPRDGLINPFVFENLHALLAAQGGTSRDGFCLRRILVQPDPQQVGRLRATKVVWQRPGDPTEHVAACDNLIVSLGPSGSFVAKPLPLATVLGAWPDASVWQRTGLLVRQLATRVTAACLRGEQLLKDFMWAAGSSSVVLICLDRAKVPQEKLDVFSKFLDGVNQHWTPIATREVSTADGRTLHCVALQMTGGGNFPSRLVRPDYVLNLLHTTEHVYGMRELVDAGAITYDLVQSRGCGRGVSAKNTIAFLPLATNCVVNYALGGSCVWVPVLHYDIVNCNPVTVWFAGCLACTRPPLYGSILILGLHAALVARPSPPQASACPPCSPTGCCCRTCCTHRAQPILPGAACSLPLQWPPALATTSLPASTTPPWWTTRTRWRAPWACSRPTGWRPGCWWRWRVPCWLCSTTSVNRLPGTKRMN